MKTKPFFAGILCIALALMFASECVARPEFYVRPFAQYTSLPADSRKTSLYHSETVASTNEYPTSRNHTINGDSLGVGISLGIVLGQERSVEFALDIAKAESDGHYYTDAYTTTYRPTPTAAPVSVLNPASTHACSFSVNTTFATFRRNFGRKTNRLRPYLSVGAGVIKYEVTETERPAELTAWHFDNKGTSYGGCLGAGLNIKLGQHADIEAGYRLISTRASSSVDIYNFGHLASLGIGIRL